MKSKALLIVVSLFAVGSARAQSWTPQIVCEGGAVVLDHDTQTSDQFQLVVHGSPLIDSMTSLRSLPQECDKTAGNAPKIGCTQYFENGRTAVIRLLKGDIDQPQAFPLQTRVNTNAGDQTLTLSFAHPTQDPTGVPEEKNWIFRGCGLPTR